MKMTQKPDEIIDLREKHTERLVEALYACARDYGKDLNLELRVKYLEETRNKNILIEWNWLGDPDNPQDDDTMIATFYLEDLG